MFCTPFGKKSDNEVTLKDLKLTPSKCHDQSIWRVLQWCAVYKSQLNRKNYKNKKLREECIKSIISAENILSNCCTELFDITEYNMRNKVCTPEILHFFAKEFSLLLQLTDDECNSLYNKYPCTDIIKYLIPLQLTNNDIDLIEKKKELKKKLFLLQENQDRIIKGYNEYEAYQITLNDNITTVTYFENELPQKKKKQLFLLKQYIHNSIEIPNIIKTLRQSLKHYPLPDIIISKDTQPIIQTITQPDIETNIEPGTNPMTDNDDDGKMNNNTEGNMEYNPIVEEQNEEEKNSKKKNENECNKSNMTHESISDVQIDCRLNELLDSSKLESKLIDNENNESSLAIIRNINIYAINNNNYTDEEIAKYSAYNNNDINCVNNEIMGDEQNIEIKQSNFFTMPKKKNEIIYETMSLLNQCGCFK